MEDSDPFLYDLPAKGGHGPSGSTKGGTYKGGTPINAGKGGK